MTPITQTKLHDKEKGVVGNCLRAAVASLLDMPLEDVAAFEDMSDDEWYQGFFDWLKANGLKFESRLGNNPPEGYCIANGPSPRGVLHSTIYKDGQLAFDPHPSRAGIVSVREFWLITREQDAQ